MRAHVRGCLTYSAFSRLRGKCSTVGYSLSAAASSPCNQLMITTTMEDHHLEWGSQPGTQNGFKYDMENPTCKYLMYF